MSVASRIAKQLGRPLFGITLVGAGLLIFSAPGCSEEGIGDPCTPEQEFNKDFLGFDEKEVNVESKSFQCRTRLCLVHHFRGRVSCPYGQGIGGEAPPGGDQCSIPGNAEVKITGLKQCQTGEAKACETDADCGGALCDFVDQRVKSRVAAQCVDRAADKAVYCSCRCADINNQQPSDQTFCTCPDGFSCERLVTSIGQGNEGLTGSYCIKTNTKYDPTTACTQGDCDKADKARQCN